MSAINNNDIETSAQVLAKVVTCDDFVLETGAHISVKFSAANQLGGTPSLNVNSTGAKNITRGTASTTNNINWNEGEVIDFVYDGSEYNIISTAIATINYYGSTKLSTSAISDSVSEALTPSALNLTMRYIVTGYSTYSSSFTYPVGYRVRYNSYVYECTTAITTPEAWNSAHWEKVDDLQTQIDNLRAKDWQTATLNSAFTLYGQGASPVKYRKIGDLVEIRGVIAPTSAIAAGNTVVTIFTLPTGYRPSDTIYEICQGSGVNKWTITVYSNGNVGFQRYGTSNYVETPTSAWLPFHVMFSVD